MYTCALFDGLSNLISVTSPIFSVHFLIVFIKHLCICVYMVYMYARRAVSSLKTVQKYSKQKNKLLQKKKFWNKICKICNLLF